MKLNFFIFLFIVYIGYKIELFFFVIYFMLIVKIIIDNSNLLYIYNMFKILRVEVL